MSAEDEGRRRFTRRGVVVGLVVAGGGLVALRPRSRAARLRPPGAVEDFAARCIRCSRCIEVCPSKAIRSESSLDPLVSDTPWIDARLQACTLCMRCTQVCPTGALSPIEAEPAAIQAAVRMGRPTLDETRCVALAGSGECRACFYVCPYPGSAIRLEGLLQGPVFDAERCVGCGLCEQACPERARAIRIVPAEERA